MINDSKKEGSDQGQSKNSNNIQQESMRQGDSSSNKDMTTSTTDQEHNKNPYTEIPEELRQCIKDCLDCYQTCTETSMHCLAEGGEHAAFDHINLMMDCAKICHVSADFMLRNSKYHPQTCGLCADICDECADDCEKFDEEFMRECANVCRRCADSCREMAK